MSVSAERGSTLLLQPAALLVVVVLAAVTVDLARVHLAQRQAEDLAAAVANDAVTVGLDVAALRAGRPYVLDPAGVDAVLRRHLDRADRSSLQDLRGRRRLVGRRGVAVTITATVPRGFSVPLGTGGPPMVRAEATARAVVR